MSIETDEDLAISNQKDELEVSETRSKMMWYDHSLDTINLEDKNIKFIDTDNYDQFMNMKKTEASGFVIEKYGSIIYIIILIIMLFFEIQKYVLKMEPFIQPNLGIVISPYLIYLLYKSFNSYSLIKISFGL
jgi:hypothetical protein